MNTNTKVVRLRQPDEIDDPLTDVLRRAPAASSRRPSENQLPKVVAGVTFQDGTEVTERPSTRAA